jgi:adenine phosphoribosyltransferase
MFRCFFTDRFSLEEEGVKMKEIEAAIRNIPDFPSPGIQFKDITPLLANAELFAKTIDQFKALHPAGSVDMVVGIEARGFVFASALACALGAGTTLLRKPGKLPSVVFRETYDLEYGTDALEIHADAFLPGQRVLLIDDLLATGGTVRAALDLIRKNFEVELVGVDVLIELCFLNGREQLKGVPVQALVQYEA